MTMSNDPVHQTAVDAEIEKLLAEGKQVDAIQAGLRRLTGMIVRHDDASKVRAIILDAIADNPVHPGVTIVEAGPPKTAPRSCATCSHWQGDLVEPGVKLCQWTPPPLPFWASISDGADHDDWTRASDGRRCKTWTESAA